MSNYPLSTKNYELLHLVGSGTYSRVYEANCRDNNQVIAIKQINLEEFPLELETIQRQTAFWSKCDHPNVVQYYGSFVDGSTLWILNEYMGAGSLKDIIKYGYPNGFKNESLVAALLTQIITGVKFFHDHHEIHRDIRSNNILVNSEGFVKLGDFGLATSLVKGGTRQGSTLSLFGEECYMAPEVLRNENGYSEKTDIWSLGLTAIELGTGKMPYAGMKFMESLVQIIDHDPPSLPDTKEYSSAYKDFVKQCLIADPAKRATAGDLLNHRFLRPFTGSLSSANLNNNNNAEASTAAAAYIKKVLSSQLPPLHTMFEKLHQGKDAVPVPINKASSQVVFDFLNSEKNEDDDSEKPKEKEKEKSEHKHHRKHGHKRKHRHHKEKKVESDDSEESSQEKKKKSHKRKNKSDSNSSEKEEESASDDSESKSYSDDVQKKSKKKKKTKEESNSDDDDDVAYDNGSSESDDSDQSKTKEKSSKRKKNKKKHRKLKDENNDDHSTDKKEEKKDVQKMGRFSVTRTESNSSHQGSSPKVTASVSVLPPSSQNSSSQIQSSSQQNLDQQARIENLANEIATLSAELTRLENENQSLKKRLGEVVETVTQLQNSK